MALINCCNSAVFLSGIIRKTLFSFGYACTITGLDRKFNVAKADTYIASVLARFWH